MSILEAHGIVAPDDVPVLAPPPYRHGDQLCATSPEGVRYQLRVETVTPRESGEFTIVGVVVAPRKLRSHLVSTVVGADGYGPAVQPS